MFDSRQRPQEREESVFDSCQSRERRLTLQREKFETTSRQEKMEKKPALNGSRVEGRFFLVAVCVFFSCDEGCSPTIPRRLGLYMRFERL